MSLTLFKQFRISFILTVVFLTWSGQFLPAQEREPDQEFQRQEKERMEQNLSRLIEEIKNPSGKESLHSLIDRLAKYGPKANRALPEVVQLLEKKKNDRELTKALIHAIVKIGHKDPRAHKAMRHFLFDQKDSHLRCEALEGIIQIDIEAKETVEVVLKKMLSKEEEYLRARAVGALVPLEKERDWAFDLLMQSSRDPSPEVRGAAIKAMPAFKKHYDASVPRLIELLSDKGLATHWYTPDFAGSIPISKLAVNALGEIGPAAKRALKDLTAIMEKQEDNEARALSARSIFRISGETEKTGKVLVNLVRSSDRNVSSEALFSLADFGDKGKEYIPELIKLLDVYLGVNTEKTVGIIDALTELGKKNASVIAVLKDLQKNAEEIDIRIVTERALKELEE